MAPPKVKKHFTWFDAQMTPDQRLTGYGELSPRFKNLLQRIGYQPGSVPTDIQMQAVYDATETRVIKELIIACQRAFGNRTFASVNELLWAERRAEEFIQVDDKMFGWASYIIASVMKEIELKTYRAFREFPSKERYNACYAVDKRLDLLSLPESNEYPCSPWPKCRIKQPLRAGSYVVVSGDTLSKISKRYYGEENLWDAIYTRNGYSGNPDLIMPGQILMIYEGP